MSLGKLGQIEGNDNIIYVSAIFVQKLFWDYLARRFKDGLTYEEKTKNKDVSNIKWLRGYFH